MKTKKVTFVIDTTLEDDVLIELIRNKFYPNLKIKDLEVEDLETDRSYLG